MKSERDSAPYMLTPFGLENPDRAVDGLPLICGALNTNFNIQCATYYGLNFPQIPRQLTCSHGLHPCIASARALMRDKQQCQCARILLPDPSLKLRTASEDKLNCKRTRAEMQLSPAYANCRAIIALLSHKSSIIGQNSN